MKETLENTTNSSVYNKLAWRKYNAGICLICYRRTGGDEWGGCNSLYKPKLDRNWKRFRRTQYKYKNIDDS